MQYLQTAGGVSLHPPSLPSSLPEQHLSALQDGSSANPQSHSSPSSTTLLPQIAAWASANTRYLLLINQE